MAKCFANSSWGTLAGAVPGACHKDGLIDVLQGFFYQWYGKELVFWSEGLVCGTKYIIFKFCNNEGTFFFPSGHWNDFVFYGYLSGEDSDAVASTLKRNGCCISPCCAPLHCQVPAGRLCPEKFD